MLTPRSSDAKNLWPHPGLAILFRISYSPTSPLYTLLLLKIALKMAARGASRALRNSVKQLTAAPVVQRRTFIAAVGAARAGIAAAPKVAVSTPFQQIRGVKTIDFAGTKETVFGIPYEKKLSRPR